MSSPTKCYLTSGGIQKKIRFLVSLIKF
jgi:hypothetical protein